MTNVRLGLAALLAIAALPVDAADDGRFEAIELQALDACVAQLAQGQDDQARECLAPMMAICVRERTQEQPVEALRACIEAETAAWDPVIDAHMQEVAAGGDVQALTRSEMLRTIADDIVESRCPQLDGDGVSDAFCELRTRGSLAIDLRLDRLKEVE